VHSSSNAEGAAAKSRHDEHVCSTRTFLPDAKQFPKQSDSVEPLSAKRVCLPQVALLALAQHPGTSTHSSCNLSWTPLRPETAPSVSCLCAPPSPAWNHRSTRRPPTSHAAAVVSLDVASTSTSISPASPAAAAGYRTSRRRSRRSSRRGSSHGEHQHWRQQLAGPVLPLQAPTAGGEGAALLIAR